MSHQVQLFNERQKIISKSPDGNTLFIYTVVNNPRGQPCCRRFGVCSNQDDFVNIGGKVIGHWHPTEAKKKNPKEEKKIKKWTWNIYPLPMEVVSHTFYLERMRYSVNMYGVKVPVWSFHLPLKLDIDPKVHQNILKHLRKWCNSEAEILGQLVGFLPYSMAYLPDEEYSTKGNWRPSDDFCIPTEQPMDQYKAGDCEDMSRLMAAIFRDVRLNQVHPLASKYCLFVVDTIIQMNGRRRLHECVILVPWVVVINSWLSEVAHLPESLHEKLKKHVDVKEDHLLPTLILESTERSLTVHQPNPDTLRKFIDTQLANKDTIASYPFPDVSYIDQEYFDRFLMVYSEELFELTGIPVCSLYTLPNTLGCQLRDLTDMKQRCMTRLVPHIMKLSPDDLASHEQYRQRFSPLMQKLTPGPVSSSSSNNNNLKDCVPIYVRECDTKAPLELITSTLSVSQFVATESSFKPCQQFDSLTIAYIRYRNTKNP